MIVSLEWMLSTMNPDPKCLKKWKQTIMSGYLKCMKHMVRNYFDFGNEK